jgi:V8-like Glu-specific endopeptidase
MIIGFAGLLVASPATAQMTEPGPPAGIDAGHRDTVDATAYPWAAVGALFNGSRTECTAVAIATDRVATAAHCLYSRLTGRLLPPESLHVLFDFVRGRFGVDATIRSYDVGAHYDYRRPDATRAADWAVLTLVAPLGADRRPVPLATSLPEAGAHVMAAGYGERRLFLMTVDKDCRVRGMSSEGLLLSDCQLAHGYSGGPLLAPASGAEPIQVVGVDVAVGNVGGTKLSAAVPALSIRHGLAAAAAGRPIHDTGKQP